MLRTMRELNAPPKIVLASVKSNQRGSLRFTAKLPTEIDDWMLFGRCTKYRWRPASAGGAANVGWGTVPRAHEPNAFSAAANTLSAFTAPPTRRKALLGR